jgi:rhodanese-related sulfurtransferase
VAAQLIDLGVTNVKALLGGYGAWQSNGMAIESPTAP